VVVLRASLYRVVSVLSQVDRHTNKSRLASAAVRLHNKRASRLIYIVQIYLVIERAKLRKVTVYHWQKVSDAKMPCVAVLG
jgi:hypothetical protein